jgi:hypothetical protein
MRTFRSQRYYMNGVGLGGGGRRDNVLVYPYDQYRMRGAGLGSIFSSLFSSVVPLFKSAFRIGTKVLKSPAAKTLARQAKKQAIRSSLNIVGDALSGKNVKESAKRELESTKQTVAKAVKRAASTGSLLPSTTTLRPPAKKVKLVAKPGMSKLVVFKQKKGGKKARGGRSGGQRKKKLIGVCRPRGKRGRGGKKNTATRKKRGRRAGGRKGRKGKKKNKSSGRRGVHFLDLFD